MLRRLIAGFAGLAAAALIVTAVYAANNYGAQATGGPITICSKDTTGGGVYANCVVPVDVNGVPVVGGTPGHLLSAASNNSTNIKASAGELLHFTVINTTATAADLRFYNSASAPTCSSATGVVFNYPIPANTTSAGITVAFPGGVAFSTGIGFCLTATNADNDNTNTVTGININYLFN